MIEQTDATIGEMVTDNFRTAAVFQSYGIDFCCRGNRTLAQACAEKGIDRDAVMADLRKIDANGVGETTPKFDLWELDFLIDYIVNNHHSYVRRMLPTLYQHTAKIASVHGGNHPELMRVASGFAAIGQELEQHMLKEEQVLFPFIKRLLAARRAGMTPQAPPFGTVRNPIAMMQREHQNAGDEMALIRELTNNYTPPEDACTTYRVTLQELQEFEQDLHRHVHLENNILFPKALRLENQGSPVEAAIEEAAACAVPSCSIG